MMTDSIYTFCRDFKNHVYVCYERNRTLFAVTMESNLDDGVVLAAFREGQRVGEIHGRRELRKEIRKLLSD